MSNCVFGVDIGGTSVKIGVFSPEAKLLDKWEIPTRKADEGAHILSDVAASIHEYIEKRGMSSDVITGVGLDVPGPVLADGTVNRCVNLGWGRFHVANALMEEIKTVFNTHRLIEVRAANDANAAALGELYDGAGAGYSSLVMVTLGTGIGGGVIINKQALSGSVGAAGEIGHIKVSHNETEKCGCGKCGCLEQYASATGIVRLAKRHLAMLDESGSLAEGGSVLVGEENLSAKSVMDAAKEGDTLALAVFEEVCAYLGEALSGVCAVVDPEVIVIGGGVSAAGDFLINGIKKYFNASAFHALKDKPILRAKLGNDGGIYGAARLVL